MWWALGDQDNLSSGSSNMHSYHCARGTSQWSMLSIEKNSRLWRISRLTSIETARLQTYPRMIVTGQGPTAYWIKFSFEIEK